MREWAPYWRSLESEARAIANAMTDPGPKRAMLSIEPTSSWPIGLSCATPTKTIEAGLWYSVNYVDCLPVHEYGNINYWREVRVLEREFKQGLPVIVSNNYPPTPGGCLVH